MEPSWNSLETPWDMGHLRNALELLGYPLRLQGATLNSLDTLWNSLETLGLTHNHLSLQSCSLHCETCWSSLGIKPWINWTFFTFYKPLLRLGPELGLYDWLFLPLFTSQLVEVNLLWPNFAVAEELQKKMYLFKFTRNSN